MSGKGISQNHDFILYQQTKNFLNKTYSACKRVVMKSNRFLKFYNGNCLRDSREKLKVLNKLNNFPEIRSVGFLPQY